ncbi:hypothetical protein CAPTEDRAFT_224132 [Capitella teleta]|uniref:SOCS box domain-containing protein n=1 Tax=Capitella teleta TaxID=283909 RepID=R7TII7_CAPTE|nr:hypothetical protein CAPTEDRAFT_224132 [Capitella teleta]|eukprot:ELT91336.1 hypothetical protein CAPTEDRAFT_224132 [Capitella teleta]
MSLTYCSEGVKPKCTQSRWLHCYVDAAQHAIIIEEFFLDFYTAKAYAKVELVLSLPESFSARIIGRPVCIACLDQHLILQYGHADSRHLHFIYYNATTDTAQFFDDGSEYLERAFTALHSVECLMSPSLTCALFRLPQAAMSDRKWSKLLKAEIAQNGSEELRFGNVRECFLRDRQNQTVAFNPRVQENIVTFILIDNYCATAQFLVYDIESKKTAKEFQLSISSRGTRRTDEENGNEEEKVYYHLHQCNAAYCRSGDVLVLLCVVYSHMLPEEAMIKLCFFDAETFELNGVPQLRSIRNLPFPIRGLNSAKDWFYPVFSPCDSRVAVWMFQKNAPPVICASACRFKKPFTLKKLCRAAVCRVCLAHKIHQLPLPAQLLSFLKFATEKETE